MATGTVTKTVPFDLAPAYPAGLFQVSPGIDTTHSLSTASCILSFIQTRLAASVDEEGMGVEEAFVHELLVGMAKALYVASGAQA